MKNPEDVPGVATSKMVDYAYPTSINAIRFGFGNVGCWVVAKHFRHETEFFAPIALSGHATREEAIDAARNVPLPWNPIYIHYHPEDSEAVRHAFTWPLLERTTNPDHSTVHTFAAS